MFCINYPKDIDLMKNLKHVIHECNILGFEVQESLIADFKKIFDLGLDIITIFLQ